MAADVRNRAAVEALVAEAVRRFGHARHARQQRRRRGLRAGRVDE